MRLHILHITRYHYETAVSHSHNEVRLMPTNDANQTCIIFELTTTPAARVFHFDLPWGRVHHFDLIQPHSSLEIRAEAVVETHRMNPFEEMQLLQEDSDFYKMLDNREYFADYLAPTERVPLLPQMDMFLERAKVEASSPATASIVIALMQVIHQEFAYVSGVTTVETPVALVLAHRSGVCQDFAQIMLSICRRAQIPCRYVSGYLYTGDGSDSLVSGAATHAWIECLLPGGHWVGFDPTNDMVVNDKYVKIQHGRDYADVPPLRGVYRGSAAQLLDVDVQVTCEAEPARTGFQALSNL